MISSLTRSAERPAIANPGQRVTITIAASLVCREGDRGYRIDYMGSVFLVDGSDVTGIIDRAADLARITMNGQVVSHDGCVGYVVAVTGAELRIHEQNIVGVLS